jgi:hypothetical protein
MRCVFVAVGIQHARRISVACPTLHYISISHKYYDFRKLVIEHKMCVLIPSKTFVCKIIIKKLEQDVTTNICWSSYKVPVILVPYFNEN